MKIVNVNIIRLCFIICSFVYFGCSSGEYDVDEHTVTYNEKTIKADTIRTIVDDKTNQDEIVDDKLTKYSYIVQIGAFVVQSNCEKFYEQAKQLLGPQVYFEFQNSLFKVRLGYFTNRAEAILLLDKVLSMGYSDAFIVTKKIN